MTKKKTLSILETIKKKMHKFDKKDDSSLPPLESDDFEYIKAPDASEAKEENKAEEKPIEAPKKPDETNIAQAPLGKKEKITPTQTEDFTKVARDFSEINMNTTPKEVPAQNMDLAQAESQLFGDDYLMTTPPAVASNDQDLQKASTEPEIAQQENIPEPATDPFGAPIEQENDVENKAIITEEPILQQAAAPELSETLPSADAPEVEEASLEIHKPVEQPISPEEFFKEESEEKQQEENIQAAPFEEEVTQSEPEEDVEDYVTNEEVAPNAEEGFENLEKSFDDFLSDDREVLLEMGENSVSLEQEQSADIVENIEQDTQINPSATEEEPRHFEAALLGETGAEIDSNTLTPEQSPVQPEENLDQEEFLPEAPEAPENSQEELPEDFQEQVAPEPLTETPTEQPQENLGGDFDFGDIEDNDSLTSYQLPDLELEEREAILKLQNKNKAPEIPSEPTSPPVETPTAPAEDFNETPSPIENLAPADHAPIAKNEIDLEFEREMMGFTPSDSSNNYSKEHIKPSDSRKEISNQESSLVSNHDLPLANEEGDQVENSSSDEIAKIVESKLANLVDGDLSQIIEDIVKQEIAKLTQRD